MENVLKKGAREIAGGRDRCGKGHGLCEKREESLNKRKRESERQYTVYVPYQRLKGIDMKDCTILDVR